MSAPLQAPGEGILGLILWLAAAGHFSILLASLQVPFRLGWREDLARLRPFNRKLFWVYGGFTVLTIVAFGTLTLLPLSEAEGLKVEVMTLLREMVMASPTTRITASTWPMLIRAMSIRMAWATPATTCWARRARQTSP